MTEYTNEFEEIDKYTNRLKVHGGWFVRTMSEQLTRSSPATHTIFIADPRHEWEITNVC